MSVTGWMTPAGEFIQCNSYEHIEVVQKYPVFVQYEPKITAVLEQIDETLREYDRYSEEHGSHNAEWHAYEGFIGSAQYEIRGLLLDAGFVRVGQAEESIYFEGRPDHLKKVYQVCRDFADSYGSQAVFEPQRGS